MEDRPETERTSLLPLPPPCRTRRRIHRVTIHDGTRSPPGPHAANRKQRIAATAGVDERTNERTWISVFTTQNDTTTTSFTTWATNFFYVKHSSIKRREVDNATKNNSSAIESDISNVFFVPGALHYANCNKMWRCIGNFPRKACR